MFFQLCKREILTSISLKFGFIVMKNNKFTEVQNGRLPLTAIVTIVDMGNKICSRVDSGGCHKQ